MADFSHFCRGTTASPIYVYIYVQVFINMSERQKTNILFLLKNRDVNTFPSTVTISFYLTYFKVNRFGFAANRMFTTNRQVEERICLNRFRVWGWSKIYVLCGVSFWALRTFWQNQYAPRSFGGGCKKGS